MAIDASGYVHLRGHSQYSLLRAIGPIGGILAQAQEHGMSAIGVTDYDGMYGAVELYENAKEITPIIGVELVVKPWSLSQPTTIVCLAMTTQGYHSLLRLVSAAQVRLDESPYVERTDLEQHHEGVLVIVGGQMSPFALPGVREVELDGWLTRLRGIYGEDDVILDYIAQPYDLLPMARQHNQRVRQFGEQGYPITVHNNYHYIAHTDRDAYETALCIKDKSLQPLPGQYHLMSGDEIVQICQGHDLTDEQIHAMIDTNAAIAARADVKIALWQALFPSYDPPQDIVDLYEQHKDGLLTG